jgi:hypothetical protein
MTRSRQATARTRRCAVRDREVAARGQRIQERPHDPLWVVPFRQEVQDRDQHESDWSAQVQGGAQFGLVEDLVRVAQVSVDERGGANRVAGHQRPRVR